jgi:3-hydroxyanthranilate 3,4-dioxygenase
LRIKEAGQVRDISIKQGDLFLLPANVPHSPQRPANTVGLVIEHKRPEKANDHMRWYCKQCGELVYDAEFYLVDLGKQLKPIIEEFKSNKDLRTCKACGAVYEL